MMMTMRSLLLSLTCSLLSYTAHASSYNAYNYDMTTPMFTPDGRLLQCEYASRAATWSSPLVVLKGTDFTILVTAKSSTRAQDRLILLQDSHIVAMSGVLSDSLSLLSHLQKEMEHEQRLYGRAATMSALKIATILGNECQLHAFGGGIRPYGSNMVVCGANEGVYQTDSSGAVLQMKNVLTVVGGSETRQAKLKSDIQKRLPLNGKEELGLHETLRRLAKILLQENDSNKNNDGVPAVTDTWGSPTH